MTDLDHPHILKLYEVYSTGQHIYLVTDFCPGGELHGHIAAARRSHQEIPESWTAEAMSQLMQAICHIHVRGIIHLDLKSQNLMLMPSQQTSAFFDASKGSSNAGFSFKPHLVVIDLGIAMHFKPGDYRGNRPMGTPMTMAPEVRHALRAISYGSGVVRRDHAGGRRLQLRLRLLRTPGRRHALPGAWTLQVPSFLSRGEVRRQLRGHRALLAQQATALVGAGLFGCTGGTSRRAQNAHRQELLKGMLQQERRTRLSASQCLASNFLQKVVPKGLEFFHFHSISYNFCLRGT